MLAQSGHKMRTGVKTGLGNRAVRPVSVLDVDGLLVFGEITKSPSGVAVPNELTDTARGFDLIVSGSLTGKPNVIAPLDRQVAGVVVDADESYLLAATTFCEMFGKDLNDICIKSVVIHIITLSC